MENNEGSRACISPGPLPFYIIFTLILNFSQLPLCINWFCICAGQEGEDAHGLPWLLLAVALLQWRN